MGQEWSGSVSAKVLREYMTLQGRPHTSQDNSKVKSHLKFTELDINASQACWIKFLDHPSNLESDHFLLCDVNFIPAVSVTALPS